MQSVTLLPRAPGATVRCIAVRRPVGVALTRRSFLVVAGGSLLAACGGGGAASDPQSAGGAGDTLPDEPWILVQRWPSTSLTPGPVRLPLSIADRESLLATGPAELRGSIVDALTGEVVVATMVATRHGDDLPAPYWPFRVELPEGLYQLRVEGGSPDGAALQVRPAAGFPVPKIGDQLPPFDTPTIDDVRGLDPICTRAEGVCPLHDVTLTEALASGKPVAYLIGTPAYCQTGTCAPAIESMLAVRDRIGDAAIMVHAEVYTDTTATTVAPAVTAYGMDYEPALFVADASGRVVERLDAVFDTDEVVAALRLAGIDV